MRTRAMRTRIKFCGITRARDAREAVRLGADAVGLVFYPESPRAVSIAQAVEVAKTVPPFVSVVGLFVDAEAAYIREVVSAVRIDLLQFHGDERPEACAGFQRPYIKALRMREGVDVAAYARSYPEAAGLLLDAYVAGQPGGTGSRFDWERIPADLSRPLILAGGLTPDNVGEAVRRVKPYAVDVSGGVEADKGIKDPDRMAAFAEAVAEADRASNAGEPHERNEQSG
ncbi:MAG TPA: phosphoribosylanthranilate isomerase [Gammaproteobacteria bacterium]|nr:phosphoribosylanthranilate isomerase [Gammaproteobacteria bacterium]